MTCKVGNGALLCFSTTRKVGNGALLVFFSTTRKVAAEPMFCVARFAGEMLAWKKRLAPSHVRAGGGAAYSTLANLLFRPIPRPPSLHFPPRFGIIEVLSPRGQPCLARAHAAAGFPRLDFGGALWT